MYSCIACRGGASSVGSCAIQLATASGAQVFTTASHQNFDYCKGLGAKQCFDYHDEDVEDQIVEALKSKVVLGAFHATGGDGAFQTCARVVDRSKGKTIVVTTGNLPEKGVPSSVRSKMSESRFLPAECVVLRSDSLPKFNHLASLTTKSGPTSGASSYHRHSVRVPSYLRQILCTWVRS